jgi:hypothetical protein
MKTSYYSYTTAQGNAVATLMRYVGQAEGMMYGVEAAGSGIYSNENYRIANMFKAFGYKSTARNVMKNSYTEANWASLIQGELAAGRPLVYCAISSSEGGHAFNVDGYRDSDSKYHVNWGWSGVGNNWFVMNSFNDGSSTFSSSQQAIVGVEPPGGSATPIPVLEVGATSLTFTGVAGQTYTKTFTVSGQDVSSDVTLTYSGSSAYTISPMTLTAAQANAGATITVTYKPTAAGTHSGMITVATDGADSKTVSLSATATANNVPTLVADPASLTFSGEVGQTYTQTFNLSGSNLTGTVYLAASGTGFTIDKTVITKAAVMNGTTVKVTYTPTTSGTHTGSVMIRSTGADTIYVNLNGTATAAPVIAVNPKSLSFNTVVGTPVTKTFTVTGTDLTGNVSLAVSGTGFSIDNTTITKNAATSGATVTVTYNPTAGGNHTGSVTLTSAGAQPVTVSLTGTATTVPSLTANPTSLSFNTVTGTPVTKTFTVTGENLTGNVTVACNGTGFSADKTTITKNDATAGATVTVTYNPASAGSHTGSITLSSSGAQSVTVALTGSATEPVRTITATPTTLNFTTLVSQTSTQTFNVTGENLTGNLTLALSDDNGVYSIAPTTITAAQAMAGNVPVTVTYAPTAFGTQSATVTISGGGAPAVTVTLNGQADLIKYAPVMLPADEEFINLTKFRADWTDQTPAANVASYTLEVSAKVVEPEVPELIGSINGTTYTNQTYQAVTLTAPWSGMNVMGGYGAIYFRNATNQSATTDGYIRFTIPAGYENKTFTVKLTTSTGQYGAGRFVVGSTQTTPVEYKMSVGETHNWLVIGSTGDVITITSPEDQYSPDIAMIEIYAGDATATQLRANETGDATYRLIEGITDKFYTVENLTPEGTFTFKVKALYLDGTESEWSNIEEVTLFQNGHGFAVGDVNHDGSVSISDVTALINALLSNQVPCEICADVNGDGNLAISDVTALINKLLSGNAASMRSMRNALMMGR